MKLLHAMRWKRRIRSVWTLLEGRRKARKAARVALGAVELSLRVIAVHSAVVQMQARRRAAGEAAAALKARRQAQEQARLHDEINRKAYGADAIDV